MFGWFGPRLGEMLSCTCFSVAAHLQDTNTPKVPTAGQLSEAAHMQRTSEPQGELGRAAGAGGLLRPQLQVSPAGSPAPRSPRGLHAPRPTSSSWATGMPRACRLFCGCTMFTMPSPRWSGFWTSSSPRLMDSFTGPATAGSRSPLPASAWSRRTKGPGKVEKPHRQGASERAKGCYPPRSNGPWNARPMRLGSE